MIANTPLISCLCVTRKRVPLLKRAIATFRAQTYSKKELVILYEDDDTATQSFVKGLADADIRIVEVPKTRNLTLGRLRNMAVASCRGVYFCQWDDDDWYHQNRLAFQMEVIRQSRFPACVLMHWLVYDNVRRQGYVSPRWPWEGSVLCRKKLVDGEMTYADRKQGEDTPFIRKMMRKHLVFPVMMPKLYIYVYHSANVCGEAHWQHNIFRASRPLSAASSRMIADILDGRYSIEQASALLDELEG